MLKHLLLLSTFILSNAHAEEVKKEILVSAAASLKDVFNELGKEFETKNNVKVSFNYAASGQLKQQIEAGAPVDVFASAAQADMDALVTKKLVDLGSKVNFTKNGLVIIQNIKSKIELKSVNDFAKPEVKKIALGTAETVPAGRYAKESLSELKIYDAIKAKLVFGENVRQVLDYVSKNEVDAGVVYSTDALSDKNVKTAFEIPESSHKAIVYPIAAVAASKNMKEAKDFITFVTNKDSQAVFKKYGFR
ncbi:MAG: molybdate ABC transporter substrate-binding protein [Rhizobacter sp.]|nr:molybdate ABC transporter substrate-binding protein [Bacteriovorax sp.]